eukprot:6819414-Alexandrium_andersonii.AAC.1
MVAWIAAVCTQWVSAGHDGQHDQMRATAAWGLATFCNTLDGSGRYMDPAEIAERRRVGHAFLLAY